MHIGHGIAALAAIGRVMPVTAACWTPAEIEAAQVRDMQTMLMVATLRCQAAGQDISADYNGFVRNDRAVLETFNGRIKARFRADAGPVEGQQRYDRFTTSLANAYGSAKSDAAACGEAATLARRAAIEGQDAAALAAIAREVVFATPVPGEACTLPPVLVAEQPAPALPGVELAVAAIATP